MEPTAIDGMLYFGCVGRAGHFLHGRDLRHMTREPDGWPPSLHHYYPGALLDGKMAPDGAQVEGVAKLTHREGWTFLAFWDRSVDKRGGSNSVFIAPGTHDFAAMVAGARAAFPTVWERFAFEVVDGDGARRVA